METPKTEGEDPFHKQFGMWWSPEQDFLYISRRFYAHWESVLAGHEVMASDPNGNTRPFTIGLKNGRPAFTNGLRQFADFYSLNNRTLLHFKYMEHLTFHFRIFRDGEHEIEYPEVIHILSDTTDADSESDSDSAEDIPFEKNIHWEKVVTDIYARGRAPLNLPAKVVQKLQLQGMTSLPVRVLNSNLAADCQVNPSMRKRNEAHLIGGWYQLCKDLKLSPGNKLQLTFLPLELQLLMRVVRDN